MHCGFANALSIGRVGFYQRVQNLQEPRKNAGEPNNFWSKIQQHDENIGLFWCDFGL